MLFDDLVMGWLAYVGCGVLLGMVIDWVFWRIDRHNIIDAVRKHSKDGLVGVDKVLSILDGRTFLITNCKNCRYHNLKRKQCVKGGFCIHEKKMFPLLK